MHPYFVCHIQYVGCKLFFLPRPEDSTWYNFQPISFPRFLLVKIHYIKNYGVPAYRVVGFYIFQSVQDCFCFIHLSHSFFIWWYLRIQTEAAAYSRLSPRGCLWACCTSTCRWLRQLYPSILFEFIFLGFRCQNVLYELNRE